MKLYLEVRNDQLVTGFSVFVDAEGVGVIPQSSFLHVKPGVYTYTKNVTVPGTSLLIRFSISGLGANVQSPTGVCLVAFDPKTTEIAFAKPYLLASITAGHVHDSEEFAYPVGGGKSTIDQLL